MLLCLYRSLAARPVRAVWALHRAAGTAEPATYRDHESVPRYDSCLIPGITDRSLGCKFCYFGLRMLHKQAFPAGEKGSSPGRIKYNLGLDLRWPCGCYCAFLSRSLQLEASATSSRLLPAPCSVCVFFVSNRYLPNCTSTPSVRPDSIS